MRAFETVDCASESAVSVVLPPDNQELGGRLRYEPDTGITLELPHVAGSLRKDLFGTTSEDYPVIVGRMHGGSPFTLLDCLRQSTRFGGAGFSEVRIVADRLLVGMHLEDPTSTAFAEIRVSLTSLNEWFGVSAIDSKQENLPAPQSGNQVAMTCKHLPPFGFSPLNGGPSLLSDQNISSSLGQSHAALDNNFLLRLLPRRHFGLESCRDELFRLQAFMSLLCGHQVFCESVRLYLHGLDDKQRQMNVIRYLARFAQPSERKKKRREDVLLPLPRVERVLPDLWAAWTDRYDVYRSAVELYTSTELFGGQLLNFQMLAIMQALETLHRNRFGGIFIAQAQYKAVEDALLAAIPTGVPCDLRNALKTRLRYGNEFSLRRRLKELARRLSPKVSSLIHPRIEPFLERAVDTRNYLTHYDEKLKTAAFHGADLYWRTRLLRWFFLSVILADLGLPDMTLAKALSQTRELTHARQIVSK